MFCAKIKPILAAPLSAALVSLGALTMSAPAAAAPQEGSPWHGFYVGVEAGGAWSTADADAVVSLNPSAPIPTHPIAPGDITAINAGSVKAHLPSGHHSTFTGGLEAGYNYVMGGGLLLGIETDVNIFDIRRYGDRQIIGPSGGSYGVHQSIDTDFLWTLRPRIGYTMDNWLIFASGGLALTTTHYELGVTDNQTGGTRFLFKKSGTRTGWTVGGGAGYAFTPNLSAKAEYLYQDFGSSRYSTTSPNGYLNLATEAHLRSHLFRAGLDYRF
jgi:outer membrane immunogenic protein